jgi:nucleotide-binding universal stress UspA family protein
VHPAFFEQEGIVDTRILLATDGAPAAAGALRIARVLAETRGVQVGVVSVVEPFPLSYPDGADVARARVEAERTAMRARLDAVLAVLGEQGGAAAGWPVTVTVGSAAPTIARVAERSGASMIVLGIGQHALADRWLGSETALRVMRVAAVPVLAVPGDADGLARQAVAAIDFTEFSIAAARAARDLVAPNGLLHLVHAVDSSFTRLTRTGDREWLDAHLAVVKQRLDEIARGVAGRQDLEIRTRILQGEPGREILRFAGEVGADLLAAGTHGAGFVGRLLLGSVSTRLVRSATGSVLLVPPTAIPAELPALDPARTLLSDGAERSTEVVGTGAGT